MFWVKIQHIGWAKYQKQNRGLRQPPLIYTSTGIGITAISTVSFALRFGVRLVIAFKKIKNRLPCETTIWSPRNCQWTSRSSIFNFSQAVFITVPYIYPSGPWTYSLEFESGFGRRLIALTHCFDSYGLWSWWFWGVREIFWLVILSEVLRM